MDIETLSACIRSSALLIADRDESIFRFEISIRYQYLLKQNIANISTYGQNNPKLQHYVTLFLNNRNQRVRIKGKFSDWVPAVGCGIPLFRQGSLLGPILFIIYINDIVEYVNNGSDVYLYADDAQLFSFIKTMKDSVTL